MQDPFEDDTASYFVLSGEAGRMSLWPEGIPVPDGWRVELGPSSRQECLAHVESVWAGC